MQQSGRGAITIASTVIAESSPDPARHRHFVGLDGLRGIAAIAVMAMHEIGLFRPGTTTIPASLAVDLFFMLSGFVLACSYGARLDSGLGWRRYMLARLVRLYPLLLVGILSGALLSFAKQAVQGVAVAGETPAALLPTLMMFPVGLLSFARGYPFDSPPAFVFNGVIWSLFFELVASAVYGTRVRRWPRTVIMAFLLASSFGLVAASAWAGTVAELGRSGLVAFAAGLLRVAVPFTIGAALFSCGTFRRFPAVPAMLVGLTLAALLFVPTATDYRRDMLAIFVAFPLVIGFGTQVRMAASTVVMSNWIGRLSYPVYLLHLPVSRAVGFTAKRVVTDPVALMALAMAATLAISWLVLVTIDEPLRRWLGGRLRSLA